MSDIPEQRHQLISVFLYKNSQINLSAIRDPIWVYNKHILDSIELTKIMWFDWKKVCDVGTWWWFPLLPLAITCPDTLFVWVDSIQKKLNAIEDMLSQLGIINTTTEWSRIEDLHLEGYDIFTVRAVAYIDKILSWTKNILKKWNKLVLYKLYTLEEYDNLLSIINWYHLRLDQVHHYTLWDEVDRVIYVLEKY